LPWLYTTAGLQNAKGTAIYYGPIQRALKNFSLKNKNKVYFEKTRTHYFFNSVVTSFINYKTI
jgi:hypothetical protein